MLWGNKRENYFHSFKTWGRLQKGTSAMVAIQSKMLSMDFLKNCDKWKNTLKNAHKYIGMET
jgi:hypothetical protein